MKIKKKLNKDGSFLIMVESPVRFLTIDNVKNDKHLNKKIDSIVWYVKELDKLDMARKL